MLRGILPFAAENDIVELFLIFVKCSKMIFEHSYAARALAKDGCFCYTVDSLSDAATPAKERKWNRQIKG